MKAQKAQMPVYGWIFVIIVGAVILLLALIFASRIIGIERTKSSAELLRKFDILLDPFSSIGGIAEISMAKTIKMPSNVEMKIECYNSTTVPSLGMQEISFGAELIKKKELASYKIYEKYIFSHDMSGKNIYIFSKPFELAFRVDDLIYVFNQSYCFIDAPEKIKEDLNMINLTVIRTKETIDDECRRKAINVCFGLQGQSFPGDCDIKVECRDSINECNYGFVNNEPFVTHSLLYAAVFSSDENYKCNFERLAKRLEFVSGIYKDKAGKLISERGCPQQNTEINNKIKNVVDKMKIREMREVYDESQELMDLNERLSCQVF